VAFGAARLQSLNHAQFGNSGPAQGQSLPLRGRNRRTHPLPVYSLEPTSRSAAYSILVPNTIASKKLIELLPKDKTDEAPKIVKNLDLLVKEATNEKPDRKWYSLSAEGLLEAAKWVKDFTGKIGGSIQNLGKSIWPDFHLPT
jgi:hypothetical protein